MTARTAPAPAALSIRDAAALLAVSETHLYNLRRRGERIAPDVPFLDVGGKCVVPRLPLLRLLGIDGEVA